MEDLGEVVPLTAADYTPGAREGVYTEQRVVDGRDRVEVDWVGSDSLEGEAVL